MCVSFVWVIFTPFFFWKFSWLVALERGGFGLHQVLTQGCQDARRTQRVVFWDADLLIEKREPVYSSSDPTVTFLQSSAAAPSPSDPPSCTQFVLGCESKQCLSWQQLLFQWSLLPRQETAAGAFCRRRIPLAGWPFPHFLGWRKQIFELFFLKTKCQHLTAGVSI